MAGVGSTREPQIEQALVALLAGRLDLWQLTPSLAGFFTAGYDAGRASLESDLERARDDADRLYEIAFSTPAERQERINRLMDAAAQNGIHPSDREQFEAMLDAALERPGRAA